MGPWATNLQLKYFFLNLIFLFLIIFYCAMLLQLSQFFFLCPPPPAPPTPLGNPHTIVHVHGSCIGSLTAPFPTLYFISQAGCPQANTGGADLGLYHPGNPRASAPSGQLQTMSEHHHPAPAQLILRWQRLVVSGHSQSLQLTGLGKSLPLTGQQQSRLNYTRRVYSSNKKGTP